MKPEEFMIGDWVIVQNRLCKVCVISEEIEVDIYSRGWFDDKDIQPVPLTPEILEKNGFVPKFSDGCLTEYLIYKDIVDGLHEMYMRIAYFNTEEKEHKLECFYCRTGGCQIWIKYVHQLQHALRLCGINKKIIL